MALAYTIQGQRYEIYEDIGCLFAIYHVWPVIPAFYMWPLVLGLISSVYCIMTFRSFLRRRSELNEVLNSGDNSIAPNRYYRLMILCCTEIVFTVPLASWVVIKVIIHLHEYISWSNTHFAFHIIWTFPTIIWRSNKELHANIEFCRWNIIICAIVFCAFFTFAEDSRNNYRALFHTAAKRFGLTSTANDNFDTSKANDGRHRNLKMSLPPMFPSRNKNRDSLITSPVTLNGLHMDDIPGNEKAAEPKSSFASSSSSSVSGSHKDLPTIPTPIATSPTNPMPPASSVTTPGNDNMV